MDICTLPCVTRIASRKLLGFPGGSAGKESACNVGDLGLIPGLGRSPGEENDNPLQYSHLGNSMDRGAWRTSPWGHKELDTAERLNNNNNNNVETPSIRV